MARNNDGDVIFEIEENLGVITEFSTGWRKELNLVSWNGGAPKYDIRDWDPNHERMSKGITLHEKEMRQIVDIFRRRGRRSYASSMREMEMDQEAAAEEAKLKALDQLNAPASVQAADSAPEEPLREVVDVETGEVSEEAENIFVDATEDAEMVQAENF